MDINQAIIKISSALKYNKPIFILGRGESTNFFIKNKKNLNKRNFIIGFNTYEICQDIDILLTNKKKLCIDRYKNKFLYTNDIFNKFQNKIIKIRTGRFFYSLDAILYLINFLCIKNKLIKNIFFVGFDFRSSIPDADYKKISREKNLFQGLIDISAQREIFFRQKNNFSNLKILHAGFDINSDCDPRFINFEKSNSYVKIVAEVTTNHFGEDENIYELIRLAKKAGADYVKFSIRDVESFYPSKMLKSEYKSPFGKTFYDYRKKLELSDKQIDMIKKISNELKIIPFFSILDKLSFLRLKKYNFNILKLPSTISVDKNFFKYISNNHNGEIVVSTGMTNNSFLQFCANLFKKNKKLYMLHCVSSYPTSAMYANIKNIQLIESLKKKYKNIIPGYSSHDLANEICAMAIACGAKMIEKHIKLGSKNWAHFDQTALDARFEFPSFVQNIKNYEKILGDGKKQVFKIENHKYFFRKNRY